MLAMLTPGAAWADRARPDMSKQVGERAPIFQLATSQGTLADYDRDYYGKHHRVLTFFPAAFTPV
jgi:peroxiredoxin